MFVIVAADFFLLFLFSFDIKLRQYIYPLNVCDV